MGVGIAYPFKRYQLLSTDISRISETRRQYSPSHIDFNLTQWLKELSRTYFPLSHHNLSPSLNLTFPLDTFNIWYEVNRRPNLMMTLELSPVSSSDHKSTSFYIGTYHMPCVFHNPSVMAIHSCLAAQHLQRLSSRRPYIFAGDFNIKPTDACYHLLTTGNIVQSTNYEKPLDSHDWCLQLNPMRSCYFDALGREPPYTNNTKTKNSHKFCDTLDYIFISNDWNVKNVIPIPQLPPDECYYPSADEPSDHIMIGTELELVNKTLSRRIWQNLRIRGNMIGDRSSTRDPSLL